MGSVAEVRQDVVAHELVVVEPRAVRELWDVVLEQVAALVHLAQAERVVDVERLLLHRHNRLAVLRKEAKQRRLPRHNDLVCRCCPQCV